MFRAKAAASSSRPEPSGEASSLPVQSKVGGQIKRGREDF